MTMKQLKIKHHIISLHDRKAKELFSAKLEHHKV